MFASCLGRKEKLINVVRRTFILILFRRKVLFFFYVFKEEEVDVVKIISSRLIFTLEPKHLGLINAKAFFPKALSSSRTELCHVLIITSSSLSVNLRLKTWMLWPLLFEIFSKDFLDLRLVNNADTPTIQLTHLFFCSHDSVYIHIILTLT